MLLKPKTKRYLIIGGSAVFITLIVASAFTGHLGLLIESAVRILVK